MVSGDFEWDEQKNQENQDKHGVVFEEAQLAFADPGRLILRDKKHSSSQERRFYCVGRVKGGVLTVRFTYRGDKIRIFGAGFWREFRQLYFEHRQKPKILWNLQKDKYGRQLNIKAIRNSLIYKILRRWKISYPVLKI